MRFIAGLVALAGIAGLVAILAPIDGYSMFPAMLKGDGATKLKAIVLLAAFGLATVLGVFAITKERMSRLHSVCTLVGFGAAAVIIETWRILPVIADGIPGTVAILLGAIGLGILSSILAMIKGRADY